MHAVDGISGGTITSDGVSEMLYERLNMYLPYLNKIKETKEKAIYPNAWRNDGKLLKL